MLCITQHLQVMIYNGQLDIIIAVPLTEAWLQTVEWSGLPRYKTADRLIWKVNPSDSEVAGYVRQVDNFYQVCLQLVQCHTNLHTDEYIFL